jgi:hypothetical protein
MLAFPVILCPCFHILFIIGAYVDINRSAENIWGNIETSPIGSLVPKDKSRLDEKDSESLGTVT